MVFTLSYRPWANRNNHNSYSCQYLVGLEAGFFIRFTNVSCYVDTWWISTLIRFLPCVLCLPVPGVNFNQTGLFKDSPMYHVMLIFDGFRPLQHISYLFLNRVHSKVHQCIMWCKYMMNLLSLYQLNISEMAIPARVKAFWREIPLPSLRSRHFASNSALILNGQTRASCLCVQRDRKKDPTNQIKASSMVSSMEKSRVSTCSSLRPGL